MFKKIVLLLVFCLSILGCGGSNNSTAIIGNTDNEEINEPEEFVTKYLPILSKSYNKDGQLTEYDMYEYNNLGNLIKNTVYSNTDNLKYYHTYEYDEKGNKLKGYLYPELSI